MAQPPINISFTKMKARYIIIGIMRDVFCNFELCLIVVNADHTLL